jgi:hypothetical protein
VAQRRRGLCPPARRGAPAGRPADADATTTVADDHDALLERLIDLEQRLADDMARNQNIKTAPAGAVA